MGDSFQGFMSGQGVEPSMYTPTGAEAGDAFEGYMSSRGFEPTMPELGDDGLSMLGQPESVISKIDTTNIITGKQGPTDSKNVVEQVATPNNATQQTPSASTPTASANVAAKSTATAAVTPSATAADAAAGNQNVFTKMFADKTGAIDKRLVGASLQAVGGAFSAASTNRLKKEQYDEEMRRRDSMSRIRYA
jgi:hypothetical protein